MPTQRPEARAGRVLLVEDDPGVRNGLAHVLRGAGYEVQCAEHGQAGLEILNQGFSPCVIVLDVAMPVMDGVTFAAELKATPLAGVPIIVMSAVSTRIEGAAAHIRKPFDVLGLLEEVERLCRPSQV